MTTAATRVKRNPAHKGKGVKVVRSTVSRSSVSGAFLHKEMTAFTTKISKDPEEALSFLKRAGIVTRTGKVAKAYGG